MPNWSSLRRILGAADPPTPLDDDAQELQSEAADLQRYAKNLLAALSNAEGCENLEDLASNLEEARDALSAIKTDLIPLHRKASKMLAEARRAKK